MEKIIKKGVKVIKTLIWNRVEDEGGGEITECELTFDDGSSLTYEIDEVDELYDEHVGIYELLEDGSYKQIEDWE